MNKPANADNLTVELTDDGRMIVEPGYLGFLRTNGHSVLGIEELHTVAREDSDKSHIVAKITTRRLPDDHPELDFVADEMELWVCDCWSFRSQSADVSEGEAPDECAACTHIKQVSKVERAKNDASQETLA